MTDKLNIRPQIRDWASEALASLPAQPPAPWWWNPNVRPWPQFTLKAADVVGRTCLADLRIEERLGKPPRLRASRFLPDAYGLPPSVGWLT